MENSTPPEDSPRQGSKVGTTAPEPPAAPQSGWADGLLAEHPSPHGQPEPPADTSERPDAHRWWTPIPSFEELTTEPQEPGLLARSDGRTLIYANELVTLYGLPGSGKSWVAQMTADDVAQRGGRVIWSDWESNPRMMGLRLRVTGGRKAVERWDGLHNIRYAYGQDLLLHGRPDPDALSWLQEAVAAGAPALIVIDTSGASGAPQDATPIYEWASRMVRPWRDVGVGVLVIDHIPKRAENRPAGPIGTQSKFADVRLALLVREKPRCWNADGVDGALELIVEKDSHGMLPAGRHQPVAVINGRWNEHGLRMSVDPPDDTTAEKEETYTTKVLAVLRENGGIITGKRTLRDLVKGEHGAIDRAVDALVSQGLVNRGGSNPILYRLTDDTETSVPGVPYRAVQLPGTCADVPDPLEGSVRHIATGTSAHPEGDSEELSNWQERQQWGEF